MSSVTFPNFPSARRLSCEAGRTRPAVPVAHVAPSPPKSRGRDRGGNFPCCKALKNLKTRKFFAVIAKRPVFRMSDWNPRGRLPLTPWIAAREGSAAKRNGPETAPQRFEKIESAPGNGIVWETSNPQDMVHGCAADHARLRLTSRKNALLQKKAPNALKSLDAELKLQPRSTARRRGLAGRRPGCFLAAARDDGWRP